MDRENVEFGSILTPQQRTDMLHSNLRTGNIDTPQFPGTRSGFSINAIRRLIKRQKRAKGYEFLLASGQTETFNINISGTARIFLGFAVQRISDELAEELTMQINNEVIIETVDPQFFEAGFMDDEYYFFPRPLSGTDSFSITWRNGQDDAKYRMIIYYI